LTEHEADFNVHKLYIGLLKKFFKIWYKIFEMCSG